MEGLADLARVMAIDAVTAEVADALGEAGLQPVLLKGPVLSAWLYDDDESRPYGDADLLVPPHQTETAERVLARMGFERQHYDWAIWENREHHARTWYRRSDHALLDLHHTLPGIRGMLPSDVCEILGRHTIQWPLPPTTVRALDEPARILMVALHLFHHLEHGEEFHGRPKADLERAIVRVDRAVWEQTVALAHELRAAPDVAHALHAVTGGAELAGDLRLPPPSSRHDATAGFERLAASRDWMNALRRGLFPSPEYLRWSSPAARSGRMGLVTAYLARPFRLAAGAIRYARQRRG